MTNPRHAALILCLLATPAGAQKAPMSSWPECPKDQQLWLDLHGDIETTICEPIDRDADLQKAADICARHIATGGEFEAGWADDCAAVNVEIVRRGEAAHREAEKPDREFVERVAKGLKP